MNEVITDKELNKIENEKKKIQFNKISYENNFVNNIIVIHLFKFRKTTH